ncbi:unnamed protein product, partial [Prorocentrum cordatum]
MGKRAAKAPDGGQRKAARGGGRRGSGAAGARESDGGIAAPAGRLSAAALQADAFECGTCGTDDVGQQMKDAAVPSCTQCFERYSKGFTHFGSLEVVQQGVQDEDSHIHDCWEEALRTEAGEQGQFFPTAVDEGSQYIVSVVKPMIGLNRAQLISDVLEGEEPEKLGIKLQDLPDQDGNTYKGVMVPNPNRPYLEYDVMHQHFATMTTHKMQPSQQMYSAQSFGTFSFVKKGLAQDSKLKLICVKARTENHTLDSLASKADAYKRSKADAERARLAAEEADGSPGGSPGESPLPAAGLPGAGASASAGPLLNPSAMACSRTVFTGDGRAPKTPGAKPRATKSAMSDTKQSEVEELVERRIAALDVDRCWSGTAMGRELRWARESHDNIMDSTPSPADSELADKLKAHLDVCDAICNLVEKPFASVPKAKLDGWLKDVENGAEDMPSKFKQDVLKLKVLRAALRGWAIGRACSADGSCSDKISNCDGFFTEALNYFIKLGKEGQPKLVQFCNGCLDWLDEKCPEDERYDELVSTMTVTLKAALCIADATKLDYKDALMAMTASSRTTGVGTGCLRHLNLSVKRSQHYTALKDEFDQYYLKTREMFPSMSDAMQKLDDSNSSMAQLVESGVIRNSLEMLPDIVMYCRPGSFEHFQAKVAAKVDEYVHTQTFGDVIGGAAGAALTAKLAEAKTLVTMAKTSVPEKLSTWASALSAIEKKESEINQFNASKGLADLASTLTPAALLNDDDRDAVAPVLQSVLAAGGKGVEAHKASATAIFDITYECVSQNCRDPIQSHPYMAIFMKLGESDWLDDVKKEKLSKTMDALKAWAPLVDYHREWMALGADSASRLAQPGAGRVVQGVRSTCIAIDAGGVATEIVGLGGDLQAAVTEMGSAAAACKEMQTAELAAAVNDLEPSSTGGDSVDNPWDINVALGGDIQVVLQRVEDTILQIDDSSFQSLIDKVTQSLEANKVWADTFGYEQDGTLTTRAANVVKAALAVKYTALLVHSWKSFGSSAPKLRRAVMTYKREIVEHGCESVMRADIIDWTSKLTSLKG